MIDPITIGGLGAAAVLFVAAHVRAVNRAIGRDHQIKGDALSDVPLPAVAPAGNPATSPAGALPPCGGQR